jgi:LmbE family N-acetylglucosaminyl deacetylase
VLVVTAHPDDEAYYIGGTLSRLGQSRSTITMVVTTYGDKGYYGPFTNVDENRRVRKAEAIRSSQTFGGKEDVFLGFKDGRVRNSQDLRADIAAQIERVHPDYLLTFDDLYPTRISHRDHRRTGEAAVQAARECGFHGWVMLFMTGAPNYRCDISKFWDAKEKLLAVHASQFHGERLERVKLSLMSDATDAAEGTEYEYVEPFRVERL